MSNKTASGNLAFHNAKKAVEQAVALVTKPQAVIWPFTKAASKAKKAEAKK